MKRPEIYLPLALIALLMLPVLYATYGSPKEGWVFAKYPDKDIPAFVVASAHVDAIADSSAERNSVTEPRTRCVRRALGLDGLGEGAWMGRWYQVADT